MNKKLNSLITAIKGYEGNEYFEGGVSYCIALDQVVISENIEKSIKVYLENLTNTAIEDKESLSLYPILNYKEDLKKIFDEWHIKGAILDSLLQLTAGEGVTLFKFKEDNYFISHGSVYSIFRLLRINDKWYVIEFYVTD